ncbi:MAG: hypothetical protein ABJG88_07140 [Litorimonas sp.]
MTQRTTKITAIIAALILLVEAGFHFMGTGLVKGAITGVESDFLRQALVGIWVMPSLHWVFIAFLSVGLSRYRSRSCAAILIAFGVWLLADGVLTFLHVGPFIGVYLLWVAGALLLTSGWLLRRDMQAE